MPKKSPLRHAPGPALVRWKSRPGSALRPIPRGAYGIVRITRGRYAGYLGYYDEAELPGLSIVYPCGLPPADYVVVRHGSLARATPTEVALWDSVNENPFAARRVLETFEKSVER